VDRSFYRFVTIHACDRQTDGRTDRPTEFSSLDRACIPCSAVIKIYLRNFDQCHVTKTPSLRLIKTTVIMNNNNHLFLHRLSTV